MVFPYEIPARSMGQVTARGIADSGRPFFFISGLQSGGDDAVAADLQGAAGAGEDEAVDGCSATRSKRGRQQSLPLRLLASRKATIREGTEGPR